MQYFWTFILLVAAAVFVQVIFIIRGLYYIKVKYPQRLRPLYQLRSKTRHMPSPTVLLFVPCKGRSKDLRENINAMLAQDYTDYKMFCITESADDTAVPVIKSIASKNKRLRHVVAGKAKRCCQKNHNLLAGIDYARRKGIFGDIYAFADTDIKPAEDWLRKMTLPLADESVFAVSGFRSLIPKRGGFSDHLHAVFSAFQALAMTENRTATVWGGSMALRRKALAENRVHDTWSTAIVDDMSLTRIIRKQKLKRVFSSDCIVTSRRTYSELCRVMTWLIRQTQFSAVYLRSYTAFALSLNSILALCMLLFPVTLILAFLNVLSTEAALLHFLLFLSAAGSISLLACFVTRRGLMFRWFLYAPLIVILGTSCSWIGFFRRRLSWAHITYLFDRHGEVTEVKH